MEDIFTIIDILLWVFIGYKLGCWYTTHRLVTSLRIASKKLNIDIDAEMDRLKAETLREKYDVFCLETEMIDGVIFAYEQDTHDFICQGKTIEEIARLAKEYRNINIATLVHKATNTIFLFEDGVIKQQETIS